ncbi:hypothetical protein OCK74_06530 [Chitinophagaceae bacterium LB-8]|uniref:Uncharacterized protein n=1 Tax=Paraflavisolibacter caeni TaxID=2982496 RepID=A0A9X3B723_9BACT|nr:hypothetical protein [Paraflavisolibacter caeni]MCU7548765.1 hypothetical protein [Paraflavisolibacter caeni]
MKKLFIILLMLVYGLSSTGTSINLHFCCGKLDGISFSTPNEKSCAKDQVSLSKKRCCDDKHLEFKLKADQEPSAKWVQAYKQLATPSLATVTACFWQPQHQPVNELATGPPLITSSLPLFIKNRVFRI